MNQTIFMVAEFGITVSMVIFFFVGIAYWLGVCWLLRKSLDSREQGLEDESYGPFGLVGIMMGLLTPICLLSSSAIFMWMPSGSPVELRTFNYFPYLFQFCLSFFSSFVVIFPFHKNIIKGQIM